MTEPADSSQAADGDHIPIIDLSTLDSPQIEVRQKLAREIYDACTQVGFFYIQVSGLQVSPRGSQGLTRPFLLLARITAFQKTCSMISIVPRSGSSTSPKTRR